MARLPPVVAFAAPSGTGKTRLIVALIGELRARGLRVGVLKSDAHRVQLDTPGKDSWRFSEAGASSVALLTAERLALFERLEGEVSLVHAVERLFPSADIVLAEGFRRSGLPTIRVFRAGGPSDQGWAPPENTIAWASDTELGPDPDRDLPVLPLDQPVRVADWIVNRFLSSEAPRQVTVLCPAGRPQEQELAAAVALRFAAALGARALVVSSAPFSASREGIRVVTDIRPQLGLLGALYTGLAASDTPEVLLVGPRHQAAPEALLRGLLCSGSSRADIVYPRLDGRPEPGLAVYSHRCLSSIQSALLSRELRFTGWWGQVRAEAVEMEAWARWDPERRAFPTDPTGA